VPFKSQGALASRTPYSLGITLHLRQNVMNFLPQMEFFSWKFEECVLKKKEKESVIE
jgi:hypothetical protein